MIHFTVVVIQFTSSSYTFNESEASPQVCVEIQSGATLKAFSVNFNNTDSSAKCEAQIG